MPETPHANRRRRWVRGLLVFLALALAASFYLWGSARWHASRWGRDADALAELRQRLGSGVTVRATTVPVSPSHWIARRLAHTGYFRMIVGLEFEYLEKPDEILPYLDRFTALNSIRFVKRAPGPKLLTALDAQKRFQEISLMKCPLSEDQIWAVAEFEHASLVSLSGSTFDEKHLKCFCFMPPHYEQANPSRKLTLHLHDTKLTAPGILEFAQHIRTYTLGCVELPKLDLDDPKIQNAITALMSYSHNDVVVVGSREEAPKDWLDNAARFGLRLRFREETR
jgi:hypothetical protein